MRGRRIQLAGLAGVLGLALSLGCTGRADPGFDREWLERVEDLSESLANDLLALSVAVRDRDLEAMEAYFAEAVAGDPFPSQPGPFQPLAPWVEHHGWRAPAGQAEAPLANLPALLEHFREIEDARFKVKFAEFDPQRPGWGHAKLKAFIVGRDGEGRREWWKAQFEADVARAGEGPWKLTSLGNFEAHSYVAPVDLFSEVALPAGVAELFPPFGVGANQGFVAHGVAVADVDLDGRLDIATTGVEQNKLYWNAGDGTFRDVAESSMVGYTPPGSGLVFLDFDNDGDADLFMAAVGRQMLLENRYIPDGVLRFDDISDRAGVDVEAIGFSAIAGDVNLDGYTDIYVACYNRYGSVMPNAWHRATNGTPNLLFINQGDGTFREVAAAWGVADSRWSYAAAFADLDEDGDLDLYVANDFGENAYYVNLGDRFAERAARAGIVDPGFGMGVWFGDYDNDGDLDLHVTNMSSTAGNRILRRLYPEEWLENSTLRKMAAGNNLYENRGDGTFRDVTDDVGGFSGGWAFGGGFVDFDNDGWEDIYTPNGFVSGKSMKDT